MRWHCESNGDWEDRMKQWHKVFAWLPVWVYSDRENIWLETVERRLVNWSSHTGCEWEYRSIRK